MTMILKELLATCSVFHILSGRYLEAEYFHENVGALTIKKDSKVTRQLKFRLKSFRNNICPFYVMKKAHFVLKLS